MNEKGMSENYMGIGVSLFLFAVLIIFSAFFVATEFAIIKIRSSRVDQLVVENRKNALALQKVVNNLDGYLSACQLGITITALGLGWLGEPTVVKLLEPLFQQLNINGEFSHILAFIISFVIVTYLHVVIGELAPKTLAIRKAEAVSLLTSPVIVWFNRIMYPFIWLLNGSANRLVRLFGLQPASEHEEAHSQEEIQIILSESVESGKINNTEYGYVNRIFAFDETVAKEIMVPRTDMVCLFTNRSLKENMLTIHEEQYTRFPVATENKDQIIGMINTKQLFLEYDRNPELDFNSLIQPILTVPEVIPVNTLLKRMQKEQVHIALLVDEYGGTSGLITIEDILEEIVGEIRDEFDKDERKEIEKLTENSYLMDGKVMLSDLSDLTGLTLDDEDVDTVGGWVYSRVPEPRQGKEFIEDDVKFIIREMGKNRIRRVEIILHNESPVSELEAESDTSSQE
ncbi:hemolysin family protein [Paenibacillus sp. 23TSA30-6]|uniref:hemolysin family protein n=1 Tax=Paenibacillus sp. 23TSA30-6 TaxID=2546104 RepID=UPI0017878AC9|nr:hemolysin family protein [Paenibacillus sp. 23TSA30-6]MBE0336723.1 HlyC/CorC family transporter [Paenibacillus sp. 23TSA30-6]